MTRRAKWKPKREATMRERGEHRARKAISQALDRARRRNAGRRHLLEVRIDLRQLPRWLEHVEKWRLKGIS